MSDVYYGSCPYCRKLLGFGHDPELCGQNTNQAGKEFSSVMKKHKLIPEPECNHCGGLHYGSSSCPYLCANCGLDIRCDSTPRCACPLVVESVSAKQEQIPEHPHSIIEEYDPETFGPEEIAIKFAGRTAIAEARVRELEEKIKIKDEDYADIKRQLAETFTEFNQLEQQLKKRDEEIERLKSCKTTYDTNLSTLANNHDIQIRELTDEVRQAREDGYIKGLEDGRKTGLEGAAEFASRFGRLMSIMPEYQGKLAEAIRALANSETEEK